MHRDRSSLFLVLLVPLELLCEMPVLIMNLILKVLKLAQRILETEVEVLYPLVLLG